MAFRPSKTDYELSPYTGLTRQGWIEAGEYMLEGIFRNIPSFDAPVVMPRTDTQITYPHLDRNEAEQAAERRAEIFEGLTRSFFIAAPLIRENPELTVCGYRIRDYYRNQILQSCTKAGSAYVGNYEEQQGMTGNVPFRTFQQTVETSALVICLWVCREEIWETYTQEERDKIAALLSSYAHANTVPQNWRLFNMLDLAFLHMEGYAIDRQIMRDHAQAILNYYAGDGWYRDGDAFDYYSCWAFNVYAPIWNLWYGYENEPYLAARFEENSNRLMDTYADFFDADGFTNMWGRSCIYRNAATSAFEGNLLLRRSSVDPGLARRIASGSLLQFLSREDFLSQGVPTLGFYGQFMPLVQGYSCAESPLWMGKVFLCLHFPEGHPFWTQQEKNGSWETLKAGEIKTTVLDGPALCYTNHGANGETILRTGKVVRGIDDIHGMWNYVKLCFNSKYPWEATPGGPEGEVDSQQYVLKDLTDNKLERANVTFWAGERDGVLYRRQFFGYEAAKECHWLQVLNLADFPVPYGIMRVDKLRLHRRPVRLTLGAYGFPDNGTSIRWEQCGSARAVILKGKDAVGRPKQLAMTIYDGWDEIGTLSSQGTNPDSERSIVAYASLTREKQYGYEPYILISQVLTRESEQDFTSEELFPIEKVEYTDPERCGGYGPVTVYLKDGSRKTVSFEGMEGRLQL